jgi:hypothetical protein
MPSCSSGLGFFLLYSYSISLVQVVVSTALSCKKFLLLFFNDVEWRDADDILPGINERPAMIEEGDLAYYR